MSDYIQRQARENAAHERNFSAWYRSLSPAQKAELRRASGGLSEAARLDKPYVEKLKKPRRDTEEQSGDPAERPSAAFTPDIAGSLDTLPHRLAEEFDLPFETASRIAAWHAKAVESESISYKAFLFQRLIAAFIEPGNLRLRAGGLAFAANLAALNGVGTLRDFAKKIGVTPAAVSKVKKWWQKELNLPPSPHGKSEAACKSYSKSQKEKHWRKKKCKTNNHPSPQ